MLRIDEAERRARLAVRHRLAPGTQATDPVTTARDLVGLHATDPMTVYLSARARTAGLTRDALSAALYEERSLLRVVGMRTTMVVVPHDLAAIIDAACARAAGTTERARLTRWLGSSGAVPGDAGAWLNAVEGETVAALEDLGETTAAELVARVPGLRVRIPFGEGRTWQGTVGVSTRILFLLAAEGRVIRGRPRGSVVSSLYRWAPMDRWVPGGLPSMPTDEARAGLVRRWLGAYGPGTLADLRWWTGWPLRDLRHALAAVATAEVDLGGEVGLVLAEDAEPEAAPPEGPWAALLPSLDPTVMGWARRDWFLGPHRAALFDRNGNAGPTAWWNGRVVGGWAQRPDGEVVVRLLEDPGEEAARALRDAAGEVGAWLGQVRVVPRFRTPLEAELAGARQG